MLTRLHTRILIIGLLSYGFIAYLMPDRADHLITLGSIAAFVSQLGLLLFFCKEEERTYSGRSLFLTVFIYTLLMSALFMEISYAYDGDTFLFSKADAMLYYTESMKVTDQSLAERIAYLTTRYQYDDWGALIFDTLLMWLIPSKFFLNLVYLLSGAVSSVYLYRIGRHFMPDMYAYLAALSYGTSSYMIFFHSSFLKESIFVFLVIAALYHLYRFIYDESRWALLHAAIYLLLTLFFRPAVTAMLASSIFVYYGYTQQRNAVALFLYLAAIGVLVLSFNDLQQLVDKNTGNGDLDRIVDYRSNQNYSSTFNYSVSIIGALLGPFPTIYPQASGATTLQYYTPGVIVKLFLVAPFWAGVYLFCKQRLVHLLPLCVFILLEMAATGYVCASLELRKILLHVPFMMLFAYFALCKYEKVQMAIPPMIYYTAICGILLIWNVIRAK